jgi:hypothetical protein
VKEGKKGGIKNLARLVLFFSLCFSISFLFFGGIRFLYFRIDAIRFLPVQEEYLFPEIISAAQLALPMALYIALLLSLSYTARRNIPIFLSVISLVLLALGLTVGVSQGILHLKDMPVSFSGRQPVPLGGPGLILSQGDTNIILLEAPSNIRGARVVSLAGRPLAYQEVPLGPNNTILGLPPIPFRDGQAALTKSIVIDFSLTSRQFGERLNAGLIPFLIYSFSLILLLASLRFVMELSRWPLANLFLGAVTFRGVLALETFLNSREIQDFLASFLGPSWDASLITPLVFCALSLLVLLYTALSYAANGRRNT